MEQVSDKTFYFRFFVSQEIIFDKIIECIQPEHVKLVDLPVALTKKCVKTGITRSQQE